MESEDQYKQQREKRYAEYKEYKMNSQDQIIMSAYPGIAGQIIPRAYNRLSVYYDSFYGGLLHHDTETYDHYKISKDEAITLNFDLTRGHYIRQSEYNNNIKNIYLKKEYEKNLYIYEMLYHQCNLSEELKQELYEKLNLDIGIFTECEIWTISEEKLKRNNVKFVYVLYKGQIIELADTKVKFICEANKKFYDERRFNSDTYKGWTQEQIKADFAKDYKLRDEHDQYISSLII